LCTGLHFAHEQGVVHRDVKPANIWLLPDGTVKLLDFGIAKIASSTVTRQGSVFGSASYMSPEQVTGGTVDARSDIFSVGVVLYELLSGRKPFEADSPTAVLVKIMEAEPEPLDTLVPDLPKAVVAVVDRALQKDPARRYARAADHGAGRGQIRA
jgi:serine/threonine-protein kinase